MANNERKQLRQRRLRAYLKAIRNMVETEKGLHPDIDKQEKALTRVCKAEDNCYRAGLCTVDLHRFISEEDEIAMSAYYAIIGNGY